MYVLYLSPFLTPRKRDLYSKSQFSVYFEVNCYYINNNGHFVKKRVLM